MKKLTNKGYSLLEVMLGLCSILVLIAIGVFLIKKNNASSNINMFKKLGDDFAYKVSIYKDRYPRVDNTYYLDYMIKDKIDIELNNPTNSAEQCNRYESFVTIDDEGKKHVTMLCGKYYVTGKHEGEYRVYELSEWKEELCSGCEQDLLYNYKKDGVEMFDEYYTQNVFVGKVNEKEGITAYTPNEVTSIVENTEILTKIMYREKKLIKKID